MTTVGEYSRSSDGKNRKTQNANVPIELGYARRTKGVERLVLVMNRAFGSPQNLPFDLQHLRHPLQYNLSDAKDPQLKIKREVLTDGLAVALRAVTETAVASEVAQRTTELDAAKAAAQEARKKFESSVLSNGFYGFDGHSAVLTFCLIPLRVQAQPLDLAQEEDVLGQRIRPFNATSWHLEHHQHSVVILDSRYALNGQLGRKTIAEFTTM